MADSKSVSSGSNATSDAMTSLSANSVAREVMVKADNSGTPVSGDSVEFYMLVSLGDPDGASTDEYTTYENSIPIVVDTNTSDPSIASLGIALVIKAIKVYAVNNSGSNAITVSATMRELLDDGTHNEVQITWT